MKYDGGKVGKEDAQAQKDRGGFRTTVENLTGGTRGGDALNDGGPDVGNCYDGDMMGKKRSHVTYK
jgi:hypothetical protein